MGEKQVDHYTFKGITIKPRTLYRPSEHSDSSYYGVEVISISSEDTVKYRIWRSSTYGNGILKDSSYMRSNIWDLIGWVERYDATPTSVTPTVQLKQLER